MRYRTWYRVECGYSKLDTYTCIICPQVGYNQADLGVHGFSCTHERSTVVECSHGLGQSFPLHWVTKAPNKIIPILNLLGIYNPDCWILIIISIVSVSIFLLVANKVATHYIDEPSDSEYLAIIPFRLGKE